MRPVLAKIPNVERDHEERRYIEKSHAQRLLSDYKDLSQSIGALVGKLQSQN